MFHADGPAGPPCIVGRYRLTGRVMGKGNYARVEEALHLDVNLHVAIKMIDTQAVKEQYVLRNLHREASVLRHLKHPNIIAIFEALRAGSHYCIVTELVTGGELCAYVARQPRGHLDESTTLLFGAQLISAVAHMHALNVVHRDLKMKNIMLTRRGDQVKIVDFGLGRTWSTSKPLVTHCGSPGYAAPEIYQKDKPYGPEVDLWSLGVVLYFMAVGRMPFPPSRGKERSAEEHRKRLVALISRGATEEHVKHMVHFSPEFRDLVQGLLTANVSRRLTLQQTVEHPWVANRLRARQMLNIPYRLSSQERALILTKVALTIKSTVQSVEAQTRQDPLGEVAAMYNILAHKQLSAYHASWALRPFNPPKRLAAEVAAAGAAGAAPARPHSAPFAPYAPSGAARGARSRQSHGQAGQAGQAGQTTPCSCTKAEDGGARGGPDGAEGRVDQPDSSASSACSALWPPPPQGQRPLPAPRQRLALLPGEPAVAEDADATTVTAQAASATAVTAQASSAAALAMSLTEPDVDVETSSQEADGADGADRQYQMACLLRDADGKERLEAVPETRVMFFTETVLDNVHNALTASLAKSSVVCPVKSALASQTGLAVRTRKAVSFSIIADLEPVGALGRHRDTGVQVNLVGSEVASAEGPRPAAEGAETAEAEPECAGPGAEQGTAPPSPPLDQGPAPPNPPPDQGPGGISRHDIVLTERLLKTVPVTRAASPEPKKYIHEGRRWPLRSPRTVYKQVKGHTKLSVSYLLEAAASLTNAADKTIHNNVALSTDTNPSPLLPTHEEDNKEDEYDEASGASKRGEHELNSPPKVCKDNTALASEKLQSQQRTSNETLMQTTKPPLTSDMSYYTKGSTCEVTSKTTQDDKKSFTGDTNECLKESSKGPLGTVAGFMRSKVKKKQPGSPRKQDKSKSPKKERRNKSSRYQRFFSNRYRVDLALVMTLERSRKNLLPSIHSPWNSPKSEPFIKPSKRALKLSHL